MKKKRQRRMEVVRAVGMSVFYMTVKHFEIREMELRWTTRILLKAPEPLLKPNDSMMMKNKH